MDGRRERLLAGLLVAILLALHLNVAWPRSGLVGGWLPAELAYRIGHVGLSWLFLLWLTRRGGRAEEGR